VPTARLWLAGFCGYLSLGAALQELPAFVSVRFGAGPVLVGLIVAVASLSSAICRPVAGRLADEGRARSSIMFGAACGVLGGLGHWWSPDIPVLVVARLLLGAGEGAVFSAAIGWAIAGADPRRRGHVAGWFGLSMWGGLALGPVLAVGLGHVGGSGSVWLAVAVLPAVTMALAATTRAAPRPGKAVDAPAADAPAVAARAPLIPRSARYPGLIFALISFGYGAINTMLLLRLRHAGIGGESVALPIFAATFLVVRAAASPLVQRLGGVLSAVTSALIEAAGLATIGLGGSLPLVLAGVVLAGIGLAPLYPAMVLIVIGRSAESQQGAAVGVMTSLWDLGIVVAGPACGALAAGAGYGTAFVVAAAASALAGTLAAALGHRDRPGRGRLARPDAADARALRGAR
jgi:MFS family permease